MKIKTGRIKAYSSIEISGQIIGNCAAQVTSKVDSVCRKSNGNLVIDLSEVTFIDSYGLGAFVYIWKQMKKESRELIFLCGGNFDLEIFSTSNLDSLFSIVHSQEDL